jgi:hypothetical protein
MIPNLSSILKQRNMMGFENSDHQQQASSTAQTENGGTFPSTAVIPSTFGPITGEARSRSASIPLPPSHVARTHSEVQLSMDVEVAEQRDFHMFERLVNGMRDRQNAHQRDCIVPEEHDVRSERSIARIIDARRAPLHSTDNLKLHEEAEDASLHGARPTLFLGPASLDNSTADGWSIAGFDEAEPGDSARQDAPTAEIDVEDNDEDEVFVLDL